MTDERSGQRVSSWGDLLTRTLELGLGAAVLTAESAQRLVNDLVNRGQVDRDDSADLVERLVNMGREQRDALKRMVEETTERTMKQMNLARQSDVDALLRRVEELERRANIAHPNMPPKTGDVDITDEIT